MTAFIAWVYAQANKVYQWFGNSFNTLYNGALNAWKWAVEQSKNAYSQAIAYAFNLFKQVGQVAGLTVDWVLGQIQQAIKGISEDVLGLFNWVEYKFSQVSAIASSVIGGFINNVYAYIESTKQWVITLFDNSIAYAQQFINDALGWLLSIRDKLFQVLTLLTPERIQALLSFLTTWLNAVVLFFQNPLIFILDVIREKFISFVCYVIAWGLGTTKYDLPNEAPWKGR